LRLAPGKLVRRTVLGALIALFSLAVLGPGGSVWAAAGPWIDHEQSRLRLIATGGPGTGAETDGAALSLGLQFELEPGWKIYWRSPGEAGYPPVVDWSASENLAEARIAWPVPHRFSLFGFETFGYSDAVVLPIDARAERPDAPVRIRAAVTYLACSEICISPSTCRSAGPPPWRSAS
jgi:suppressor for copper-sensitivity B